MQKLLFAAMFALWWLIPAHGPAESTVRAKTIEIGFIAPLTGPFPDWGESIRRGVEIALLDTRHKFLVDYQDDACHATQALSIAQRFFSQKNIKYVVGPGCDHTLLAIAPIAAQSEAILFSTGLLGENVFAAHKNVINFATQISAEARRLARYMRARGVRKLSIVHGTNTFGEEYNVQLQRALSENGAETYSQATDLGTTDFRSLIMRLLQRHPDGVFIHQGNIETITFIRQVRALNSSIPIYGYYSVENESFKNAGAVVEGVTYAYPLNTMLASDARKSFDARYIERFGPRSLPSATSYYVYDGMMVLDRAFDSCAAHDQACVLDFFHTVGKFRGISGDMLFRSDGGNDRVYGIKRMVGGNFEWLSQDP